MEPDNNDSSRFFELLARKKSGEITLEEQRELKALCLKHPAFDDISTWVESIFRADISVRNKPTPHDAGENWERFKTRIARGDDATIANKPVRKLKILSLVAAAAILLIATGIFVFRQKTQNTNTIPQPNIVSTKKASRSNLVLPDGTQVWLNADSRISYTGDFSGNREVQLKGEAFFEVAHDKLHPFIVRTAVMDIKVVGTAFNVRAYDNEENTQATLVRGVIEVSLNKKNGEKITLKPNEKLTVQNDLEKNEVTTDKGFSIPKIAVQQIRMSVNDTLANEVLWIRNKLVFDQDRLTDIAAELERWYNVRVIVTDTSLLNRSLSGIYENESLEEVLESFRLAAGLNYSIKGNVVEIFK